MLNVVDLSNHNRTSLTSYPADAYVFKASEGKSFIDKNMQGYIKQARAAGKPFGLYHFMSDDSNAETQAKHFLNIVKDYVGEAILVLDYEMYGRLGTVAAKQFLDYVYKATGVKPLMYMSASVTKEENWLKVVEAGYKLWVADYTPPLDKLGYWSNATMWQYTEVPHDKNYFYGDKKYWKQLAQGNKQEADKPTTPTKPTKPKEETSFMATLQLTDARNLRTGPSTKKAVIAGLVKGQQVKLTNLITSEGYIWGIQNRSDGTKGYITIKATDKFV